MPAWMRLVMVVTVVVVPGGLVLAAAWLFLRRWLQVRRAAKEGGAPPVPWPTFREVLHSLRPTELLRTIPQAGR